MVLIKMHNHTVPSTVSLSYIGTRFQDFTFHGKQFSRPVTNDHGKPIGTHFLLKGKMGICFLDSMSSKTCMPPELHSSVPKVPYNVSPLLLNFQ